MGKLNSNHSTNLKLGCVSRFRQLEETQLQLLKD